MKDLLAVSLSKSGKQNQVISSIVWKNIIQDVKNIKNIDITNYIISIKVKENIITIKTSKPILNTELLSLEHILTQNISDKLENIGIVKKNLKIRFQ